MLKRASFVALSLCVLTSVAYAKRSITVQGRGTASYTPRNAKFHLNASKTAPSAQAASSQNAQAVQALKGKLQRLGVKPSQIKLGYASTRPNYQRTQDGHWTRNIESWTTHQQVTVKVPFKAKNNLIGKVFSASTGVEGVKVHGPTADVRQRSVRSAERRARKRAVADAVKEAKGQVNASGVARLGRLLEVKPTSQGGSHYPRGMMLESAAARSVDNAPTAPEFSAPDPMKINQSVDATFSLRSKGLLGRLGF
jgi:uncharacterized protein YggE